MSYKYPGNKDLNYFTDEEEEDQRYYMPAILDRLEPDSVNYRILKDRYRQLMICQDPNKGRYRMYDSELHVYNAELYLLKRDEGDRVTRETVMSRLKEENERLKLMLKAGNVQRL